MIAAGKCSLKKIQTKTKYTFDDVKSLYEMSSTQFLMPCNGPRPSVARIP